MYVPKPVTSQDTKNNTSTESWESKNYCLNTAMTYAFSLIRGLDTSHLLKGYLIFFLMRKHGSYSNSNLYDTSFEELLQLFFSIFVYNFIPSVFLHINIKLGSKVGEQMICKYYTCGSEHVL